MASKRGPVDLPEGMRDPALLDLHVAFRAWAPHVYAWLNDRSAYGSLQVKLREDDSLLAIAKGFSGDGTPVVAFGTGFDYFTCIRGLNGALASNRWKPDKPWSPAG